MTFVDFNGFSVKFSAGCTQTEVEILGENLRIFMWREIRGENSETFSGSKNSTPADYSGDNETFEVKFRREEVSEIHVNPSKFGFSLSKSMFWNILKAELPSYVTFYC